MAKGECKFCVALEFKQKYQTGKVKDDTGEAVKTFRYEYSVALVDRIFKIGGTESRGRSTDYCNQGAGYKLNYCPTCGKKLH